MNSKELQWFEQALMWGLSTKQRSKVLENKRQGKLSNYKDILDIK